MYKIVAGVIIAALSTVALITLLNMKKPKKIKREEPIVIEMKELASLPSSLSSSSSSDLEEVITYQHNDIGYIHKVRSGLYNAIKYNMACIKMASLIDCPISDFITYIEEQFVEGMTWKNYGTEWHIDNIIHHKFYELDDTTEYKCCFNYRNLKPAWIADIENKPLITMDLFEKHKSRLCESVRYRLEVLLWW